MRTSFISSSALPALVVTTSMVLSTLAFASDPISLHKPISESSKPDRIYWTFDEGNLDESEPNPVFDKSENEFEGFLLPGENGLMPVYVEGKFGTGIRLPGEHPTALDPRVSWNARENPGSDESRLDLADQSFTAGAWVKFNKIKGGELERFVLFERGFTSHDNSAWQLSISKSADGQWHLQFHLPGTYRSVPIGDVNFDDGEWHHVAISLEPIDGGSSISFWFDGLPLAEGVLMDENILPMDEGGKDRIFTVGERHDHYHYSQSDVSVDEVFVTSGIYRLEP